MVVAEEERTPLTRKKSFEAQTWFALVELWIFPALFLWDYHGDWLYGVVCNEDCKDNWAAGIFLFPRKKRARMSSMNILHQNIVASREKLADKDYLKTHPFCAGVIAISVRRLLPTCQAVERQISSTWKMMPMAQSLSFVVATDPSQLLISLRGS